MPIVRDAVAQAQATTYAHTCSVDASLIVLMQGGWDNDPNCAHPTSVTYAGVLGTLREQVETGSGSGNEGCGDLYYLTGPSSGNNNVVWVGGQSYTHISVSYEGVDIGLPIDNSCQSVDTVNLLTAKECQVSCLDNGLGCGMSVRVTTATTLLNQPVGLTILAEVINVIWGGGRLSCVEGPVPMTCPVERYRMVTAGATHAVGEIAIAMKLEEPGRGRAIKYFYNFWDEDPKVRDEAGREIPPNEIRPDNWIEAEGIELPSFEPYDSFIPMPSRSKIVEVNADDRSASIKTSKSQFAAVLIERAAAGRG